MDNNTIEIRDNEINVEEIMAKIRENIRRRKAAGELPPDPDLVIESASKNLMMDLPNDKINYDLSFINTNWDIHNHRYTISSHQPYVGKFLVKGRQLVHGEVCRYVDPIISSQTNFNASIVRILNQTSQRFTEMDLFISQQCDELSRKYKQQGEDLTKKFSQQENKLDNDIKYYVNSNIKDVFSQIDKDLRLQTGLTHILEQRMQNEIAQKNTTPETIAHPDTNYFLFEERFRGAREVIKQRQLAFLPYFENCSHVLDIGCGRGEFLELLRNHTNSGVGVDSDPDMVAYCQSRQLDVEQSDAITYLEKLDDTSLDGIFIDQVVEHLEPDYLVRLLVLCYRKLKEGHYIVIETVNPLSFVSFVNFYIDLTHKRPVHPETLQYLLSVAGFKESERKFFSPVSDEARLRKISDISQLDEPARKSVEVYNYNIDMLNNALFGAQDYALIAKK